MDRRNIDTTRDTPSVLLPEMGRAPQAQAQVSASNSALVGISLGIPLPLVAWLIYTHTQAKTSGEGTWIRTAVCIFEGIMDAELYTTILRHSLLPFPREVYPAGHRLMQDNDPKHTSRRAVQFFNEGWRTLLRAQT